MTFFEDCDEILKLYYEHFFNGPFDENRRQIWPDIDHFDRLCREKLETKNYGYVNAVHHQLVSGGYLKPLGETGDLTMKNHYMTPKGFSFYLTGGFKKQIEDLNTQAKYVRMSATSTKAATNAQWFFGAFSILIASISLYFTYSYNNEIQALKNEINALKKIQISKALLPQHQIQLQHRVEKLPPEVLQKGQEVKNLTK